VGDHRRVEVLVAQAMGAVVVGTDFETSKAGLALATQHDFLWASVGLHPNPVRDEVSNGTSDQIKKLEELAKDPKVVAIGECGIDYFRSGATLDEREKQRERFQKQIELALKLKKPLIIHCRPSSAKAAEGKDAHDDMLEMLFSNSCELENKVPVVMHFFTGTAELAQKYLDLGCYLSFPGPITYTDMYDESVRATPLDKILAETDAPFAAPAPYRGKRNEPAYTTEVVRKLAALKRISVEEMGKQTTENAQRVFGLQ